MQEAKEPNIGAYATFNSFFARPLRTNARPIDATSTAIVFPADGIITQCGRIKGEKIFQAKGHHYSLEALLAGNHSMIKNFFDGSFTTTYLAPNNYHRIHMPYNGALREMLYVPGNLFSVNPPTAGRIPNLFARNERLICLFETDFGPMAQILIGAIIVGSIETVWEGAISPPREEITKCWHYPGSDCKKAITLLKGEEMGRFKLGSTVINLFSRKHVVLAEHLAPQCIARVGLHFASGIKQIDRTLF